ncbi:Non-specific serine/threonine protein kinase [Sulfidibacter corallicola]|uniref:Serine/threonine protein kinase n=1 Tax=Sulfidibacter corallicola TaxID=2818388 RepID=A0A8A4THA0_SULCO|nr:serine/threonine-protein kinase [Sulfidibacter corallicola]QTD48887.1 serine/threonine protein kinase [Sulfidibacter corallicola]
MDLKTLESYYLQLLEMTEAERSAFLDDLGKTHPDSVARLRRLLSPPSSNEDLLEPILPAHLQPLRHLHVWASLGEDASLVQVGPYQITGLLGYGGMGVVYRAERDDQYKKIAAVKVIKAERNQDFFYELFEKECQTLALMEHEHIARFYDAGTSEQGYPCLAMEFVDGISISDFCSMHKLSLSARIRLFQQVCDGVAYAHTQGVIHGDLKPSNILVIQRKEGARAKIIDFGIAKVAGHLLEQPPNMLIGSPAYMSPQWADVGSPLDTRSDIYALGAVLFELIAGTPPIDVTKLDRDKDLRAQILRVPRLELDEVVDDARAEALGESPSRLKRKIAEDLNWISKKALALDPKARYQVVEELKGDLHRFLVGLPVRAAPERWIYIFRKWRRRHRAVACAAFVSGLGLVTAFVALALALHLAKVGLDSKQKVVETHDFYNHIVTHSHPDQRGPNLSFADVLAHWEHHLDTQVELDSEQVARLRMTLGNTCYGLGLYRRAEHNYAAALDWRKANLGGAHPDTLASLERFALVKKHLGQVDDAGREFQRLLELSEPGTRLHLIAECSLAELAIAHGGAEEVETHIVRLKAKLATLAPDDSGRFLIQSVLIAYFKQKDEHREAERMLRTMLDEQERFPGQDDFQIMLTRHNLANEVRAAGRHGEALVMFQELARIRAENYGENHLYTIKAGHVVSVCLKNVGKTREAFALIEDLYQRAKVVLGADHPATLEIHNTYAHLITDIEGPAAGVIHYRSMIDVYGRLPEPKPEGYFSAFNNLAHVLNEAGAYEEALETIDRTIEEKSARDATPPTSVLNSRVTRAEILENMQRFEEARRAYREVVEDARETDLPAHHLGRYEGYFGLHLARTGFEEEAISILESSFQKLDDSSRLKQKVSKRLVMLLP